MPPSVEILQTDKLHITKIKYKHRIISVKAPDNIVLLNNNVIFQVEQISGPSDSLEMKGRIWKQKKSLFQYPFDSKHLHMWQLKAEPSRT